MFWKAFVKAWRESREAKKAKRYLRVVSTTPFTVELLRKIATDYGYGFRIDNVDGTKIVFEKREEPNPLIKIEEQSMQGYLG